MLNNFDWIRRSRTGSELLGTMRLIDENPDTLETELALGPPHSALGGPCQRCWIYAPQANSFLCSACQTIQRNNNRSRDSYRVAMVWGYVNQLPRRFRLPHMPINSELDDKRIVELFIKDETHFLMAIEKRGLRPWIKELILYDGGSLKGMLQIFPTTGSGRGLNMNDLLARVVHRENIFGMDQLRVRFFGSPYQVIRHYVREKEGLLTFGVSDFLGLLEMAVVFRQVLRPQEQEILHELLTKSSMAEEQFYWGRFLGILNQEAKDMLHAWQIRAWSQQKIGLLYELINYVYVDFAWLN